MKWPGGMCLIFLSLSVSLSTMGCSKSTDNRSTPTKPIISGLVVQTVANTAIPDEIEAVGSVRSLNAAQISARIAGTVSGIYVREGDRVHKGKLLMTISSAETAAGAAGAMAVVEQAAHGVEEARTRNKLADQTFERYHRLLQEEAVTRQEYDGRVAERDMSKQALLKAEAALVGAREGARSSGSLASYARISAPMSGVISRKLVDAGMTVFPGTQLLTIEGEGNHRLEVSAPESLLGKVKLSTPVAVHIEGYPSAINGSVDEIVPIVDRTTRTFIVKVVLPVTGLRSGSYGQARFTIGSRYGMVIPKGAVFEKGALTSVWIVGIDKTIRMRIIKAGKTVDDKVEILSGLNPGEVIVTAGLDKVVDGGRFVED